MTIDSLHQQFPATPYANPGTQSGVPNHRLSTTALYYPYPPTTLSGTSPFYLTYPLLIQWIFPFAQIHSVNQPAIKHNVKSLITSPGKMSHGLPQLEAMERAKYEESKGGPDRVRQSVVNSTGVLRSTHQEANRTQLSPGMYEDANARRTPVNYSTNSRSSPMLGRAPDGRVVIPVYPVCNALVTAGTWRFRPRTVPAVAKQPPIPNYEDRSAYFLRPKSATIIK